MMGPSDIPPRPKSHRHTAADDDSGRWALIKRAIPLGIAAVWGSILVWARYREPALAFTNDRCPRCKQWLWTGEPLAYHEYSPTVGEHERCVEAAAARGELS
jgi:hypothetical protein